MNWIVSPKKYRIITPFMECFGSISTPENFKRTLTTLVLCNLPLWFDCKIKTIDIIEY